MILFFFSTVRFWLFFENEILFYVETEIVIFFSNLDSVCFFDSEILLSFETAVLCNSEIQILFLFEIEIGLQGPPQVEILIL